MNEVRARLEKELGDRVRTDPETLSAHRHDSWVLSELLDLEGRGGPSPLAVVEARSTADVQHTLRLCRELRLCFIDSSFQITMLRVDPLEVCRLADKGGGVFLHLLLQLPARGLRLLELRFKCRKPGLKALLQRRHSVPQFPKLIACCRRL